MAQFPICSLEVLLTQREESVLEYKVCCQVTSSTDIKGRVCSNSVFVITAFFSSHNLTLREN